MKKLLIACALFAVPITVRAQAPIEARYINYKPAIAQAYPFLQMAMARSGRQVIFTGIPAGEKSIYAVLTNATGDIIKQVTISPQANTMDIHKLQAGLYFITIIHKNTNKNAFILTIPAVKQADPFCNITIAMSGSQVTFSGIPAAKSTIYAVLTNAQGNMIRQVKVSPQANTLDIHKLHPGLYFVTIVYENTNRNAFIFTI